MRLTKPLATAVILIIVGIVLFRCIGFMTHSNEIRVTYMNQGASELMVTLGDGTSFELKPGDSQLIIETKDDFPDHVAARDSAGVVRFDKTISLHTLQTNAYKVVIR